MKAYDALDVPVDGGLLRVGRWTADDPAAPVVLAVHRVTANHLSWQSLGALGRFTVVAADLRGRGRSSAAQRLTMTFATVEDYLDFWRPHPAFAGAWTPELQDYLRYDLDDDRSSVSVAAVRDDSADLLDGEAAAARVAALGDGTVFLRAPAGMLGDPGGLYPAEAVAEHLRRLPRLTARDVPGTNHYTIVMSDHGARAVADAVGAFS